VQITDVQILTPQNIKEKPVIARRNDEAMTSF
jgi:hypothetical protein